MAPTKQLEDAPESSTSDESEETIASYNPATGEVIDEVPIMGEADVNDAVERAHQVQNMWGERSIEERAQLLRDFRDVLVERRMEIANLLTREVGKPTVEALTQEIAMTAEMATYYAKQAPETLQDKRVSHRLLKNKKSTLAHEPKGVIGLITPWNYPLVLTTQSALAAIVAGNAVVNKPSEITPLTSLKIQQFLEEAGFPEDIFQVVTGAGATGAALVEADVQHISFTGSVETGRKIASRCGERLISSTMELGGKDAALVLDDAPLERTTAGLTWGAFTNAGQICASVERVFVHESIYDDVVDGIVEQTKSLRMGPGTEDVDVGPMAMEAQRKIIEEQVEDAREKGANILTGGQQPDQYDGNFYEPTVIVDVKDDMKVIKEESFGPVMPIIPYKTETEAVREINDSPYGLTASVWTSDSDRGMRYARKIKAGSVYINDHVTPQGGPEVPWGGVKDSGVGRTRGEEGLLEMTDAKHISVDRFNMSSDPFWFPYTDRAEKWFDWILPWPFKSWLGG